MGDSRGGRRAAAAAAAAIASSGARTAKAERAAGVLEAKNAAAYAAAADSAWLGAIPEAPTFYPTEEEAADPIAYIRSISAEASKFGIVKVVVPYPAASAQFEKLMRGEVTGCTPLEPSATFQTRIQPVALQTWRPPLKTGIWWLSDKQQTLSSYEAEAAKYARSVYGSSHILPSVRTVEADLWRARSAEGAADRAALAGVRGGGDDGGDGAPRGRGAPPRTVFYGDNVHGSLFLDREVAAAGEGGSSGGGGGGGAAAAAPAPCPLSASRWNLRDLARAPGSLLASAPDIPGVTTPMLYIGMLHSSFAWHVEDNNLLSINYGHGGFPKVWYGVPAAAADALEAVAAEKVYGHATLGVDAGDAEGARSAAAAALAAKTTIFSPRLLVEAGVPVCRAVQEAGTFIVTWPRGYHSGFSAGLHVGEAVNFATPEWLPWGGLASGVYAARRAAPIVHLERLLVDALARTAVRCLGRGAVGGALLRRAAASAAEGGAPVGDPALDARLAASERAAVLLEGAVQLRQLASARGALAALDGRPPGDGAPAPAAAAASGRASGKAAAAAAAALPAIPLAPRDAPSVCEACGQGAGPLLRVWCHAGCDLCVRCAAGGQGPVPLPDGGGDGSSSEGEGEEEAEEEGDDPAAAAARAARAGLALPLPPGAGVVHVSREWEPALAAWTALAASAGVPGAEPASFAGRGGGAAVAADLAMDLGGLGGERGGLVGRAAGADAAAAAAAAAVWAGGRGRRAAAPAGPRPRPTPSPRGGGGGGSADTHPTPAAPHPARARGGTADPAPPAVRPRSGRPQRAAAVLANERMREGGAAAEAAEAGGGGGGGGRKRAPPGDSGGAQATTTTTTGGGGGDGGPASPRPSKRAAPAAGSSKPTPRRKAAAAAMAAENEAAAAAAAAASPAARPPPSAARPADSDATITIGSAPPLAPTAAAATSPSSPAPASAPPPAAEDAPTAPAAPARPRPLPRGATYLIAPVPALCRPRPPVVGRGRSSAVPPDVPLAAYQRRVYARVAGSAVGGPESGGGGPADGGPWPALSPTDPADRLLALTDAYCAWSGGRGAYPAVAAWVAAVAGAGAAVPPPARSAVLRSAAASAPAPAPAAAAAAPSSSGAIITAIGRACTAKLYAALQDPAAKARLKAFVEGVWGDDARANPCGTVDDFLLVGYGGSTPEEGREGAGGGPEGCGGADGGGGSEEGGGGGPASPADASSPPPPRVPVSPPRRGPGGAKGGGGGAKRGARSSAAAAAAPACEAEGEEAEAPPPKKRAAVAAPPQSARPAPPPAPAAPAPPAPAAPEPAPPAPPAPAADGKSDDDDDGLPIIASKRRPGLEARMARLGAVATAAAAAAAPPPAPPPAAAPAAVVSVPVAGPPGPAPPPAPVPVPVVVVPTAGAPSDRTPKVPGPAGLGGEAAAAATVAVAVGAGRRWLPSRLLSQFGRTCDAARGVVTRGED